MKTKLLMLMLFLNMTNIYAQQHFVDGAVVKGKNATYICEVDQIQMEVRNANNTYKTDAMFYDNGKAVGDYHPGGKQLHTQEDMHRVLQEVLTPSEYNALKSAGVRGSITMVVVMDKQGNVKEIYKFGFRTSNPVLPKLDADRFYLLEEKLKKVIKFRIPASARNIKNMIYLQWIDFK